ncbi:hypothetical protein E3T61_13870 [Cryobacterium lactosi]|uniref:Uncharacterized protein n=1 Tax=Cryobacterium lactosi TaxID=1259202 RepID=A0A4R9BLG9_9MICO|nr:hypothetical protein [Cryobacterium lactosi]TFD86957.1 hypothetical protein E3T61_13870 [Cryobacterium lactosi]
MTNAGQSAANAAAEAMRLGNESLANLQRVARERAAAAQRKEGLATQGRTALASEVTASGIEELVDAMSKSLELAEQTRLSAERAEVRSAESERRTQRLAVWTLWCTVASLAFAAAALVISLVK